MRWVSPLPDIRNLNLKQFKLNSTVNAYDVCSWSNINMFTRNKFSNETQSNMFANCWDKETYDRVNRTLVWTPNLKERDIDEELK